MAKTDNTRSVTYDIKSAVLDTNVLGKLVLTNDEIGEIELQCILSEYLGKEIDFKIGGAIKISSDMFIGEDD